MAYIIQGPSTIGTVFGTYGFKVPDGKFAVVEDREYNNGGRGPCQAVRAIFTTEEKASRAALVYQDSLTDTAILERARGVPEDWREFTDFRPRVVRP